jgi:hypothetical protein
LALQGWVTRPPTSPRCSTKCGETLTRQVGYPDLEPLLPYARFWAATLEL